jgi:UDP-N-acetyl-D-mannosaminuronic acid dehydrogenase
LQDAGVDPKEAGVTVLGYAYLENSGDTRNTPAVPLIGFLRKLGIRGITIHDPFVRDEECPGIERDIDKALNGADCACLVTKHRAYESLEIERVKLLMRHCVIIDGRNAFAHWHGFPGVWIRTIGRGK